MQMPFQYSLHVLKRGCELEHYEYLGSFDTDPRRELCKRMLEDIPASGSILAYNMGFELARIKSLAEIYPQYHDALLAMTDRFVDLIEPFRSGAYYHPNFNGSFSIKSVMPALIEDEEELSYDSLAIHEGGMATEAFLSLDRLEDQAIADKVREDLLAYCRLDTLAMVRIWSKLEELVSAD
jgi:hypothetical protein